MMYLNGREFFWKRGRGHVLCVYNETGDTRAEGGYKPGEGATVYLRSKVDVKIMGDGAYAIIYYFIYRAESITGHGVALAFFCCLKMKYTACCRRRSTQPKVVWQGSPWSPNKWLYAFRNTKSWVEKVSHLRAAILPAKISRNPWSSIFDSEEDVWEGKEFEIPQVNFTIARKVP